MESEWNSNIPWDSGGICQNSWRRVKYCKFDEDNLNAKVDLLNLNLDSDSDSNSSLSDSEDDIGKVMIMKKKKLTKKKTTFEKTVPVALIVEPIV